MQSLLIFAIFQYTLNLLFGEDQYSTRYDYIDFTEVLKNERTVLLYLHCLLNEGPCTAEGRFFKETLPEAVATNCRKCSPAQRKLIRMSAHFVRANFDDYWSKLLIKYDPDHKYYESFSKFLNEKEE